MLGLGLGLSKGSTLLSNLKLLTRNSDWAIWGDKASGQSFPTLAERTLPNGVKNGIHTKNVSDDKSLLLTNISSISTTGLNSNIVSTVSNLYADRSSWTDTVNGKIIFGSYTQIADVTTDDVFLVGTFATRSDGRLKIGVPKTITTVSAAYDYLKDIILRYQLATAIDTLNSPQVNPIVDLVGVVGKNLFDPTMLNLLNGIADYSVNSGVLKRTSYGAVCNISFINSLKTKLKPNTQYTLSYTLSFTGTASGAWGSMAVLEPSFEFLVNGATGRVSGTFNSDKILDTTNLIFYGSIDVGAEVFFSNFQLEPGSTATAYEPYGKSNGLLTGFAFTTASGYVDVVAPNGKTVTGIQGDGVNDVIVLPSNAPNPTTGSFAFGLVVKTGTNKVKYLLTRNATSDATTQYAFKFDASGNLFVILEGVSIQIGIALSVGFHSIWLERDSGTLKAFIDGVETYSGAHSTTLTSRANTVMMASTTGTGTYTGFSNDLLLVSKYCDSDIAKNRADWFKFDTKVYGL